MSDQLWVYVPLVVVTVLAIASAVWGWVRIRRARQPRFPDTEARLKSAPRPWEGDQE